MDNVIDHHRSFDCYTYTSDGHPQMHQDTDDRRLVDGERRALSIESEGGASEIVEGSHPFESNYFASHNSSHHGELNANCHRY